MKHIIEKRNYIILIIIIILFLWIMLPKERQAFVKSYEFNDELITFTIYDKINEKEVDKKIKSIYKSYENYAEKLNGKLDENMKSFIEYGKVLYTKTNGYVDITSGELVKKLEKNENYNFTTMINEMNIKNEKLSVKIDFNIDNLIGSYATSDITDYFRDKKIAKYIINENGNIIVGERYNASKYKVSINKPNTNKILKIINLENESMTTLNKTEFKSYMVNPKTSQKENKYDSIVVVSKYNLTTNMIASYLYFLDIEDGKQIAKNYNCEVLWYYEGKIETTDNFSKYIS